MSAPAPKASRPTAEHRPAHGNPSPFRPASRSDAQRHRERTGIADRHARRACIPMRPSSPRPHKGFEMPERWIWAVMRAESAGDVRAISSAGCDGIDAGDAGDMGRTARPSSPRREPLRSRATTSWRARPICARCSIATGRRAFSRRIMRGRDATKPISPVTRSPPRPEPMLPHWSLPSAAVTLPVRSPSPPPILPPGHARHCSLRAPKARLLSIPRRSTVDRWKLRPQSR